MAIRQFVFVDEKAIREMISKIAHTHDDLKNVMKSLKSGMDSLHSDGFRDVKFRELKNKVDIHANDMQNLLNFMQRHEAYLKSQEALLVAYLNSQKLK
jgi:uncharacterized protein (UPF0335 family)